MKGGPVTKGYNLGFKSAKDILQENLNSVKSTTVPPAPLNRPKSPGDGRDLGEFQRTHGTESKGETRAGESRC